MSLQDSEKILNRFLREIRLSWQLIFLISVVAYGLSFFRHVSNPMPVRLFPYFRLIDLLSFAIAIGMAIAIFLQKRKYFSLRALRIYLESFFSENPGLGEKQLAQKLTRTLKKPLLIIWLMGGTIVLVGVIFFWWTYSAKNMHIYFIVGLYSLMMNYPRKSLFLDLPYLIHEIFVEREKKLQESGTPER